MAPKKPVKRQAGKPAKALMSPRLSKDDAIAVFGTGTALAESLGITRAAVGMWKDVVPEQRVYQLLQHYPRRIRPFVKYVRA